MTRKVKRKRLNIKRTLFFLLLIYIIGFAIYTVINRPIRHIEINGNELVLDSEILRVSKLKDYPSIIRYTSNSIESKIKTIKLIDEVEVKKWFGHKIIINIKENKVLFYYKDKIVLSNGNIIKNNNYKLLGIPTFNNDVNKELLEKFIDGFSDLSDNIIYEINEIEYYPLYSEDGKIISDDRFKIVMNDGNTIIANTKTVSVLNKYNDIYASLNEKRGTINLDSNKINNLVFIPYEE